VALPTALEIDNALLLVKKGNQQRIQSMVCELGLDKQITVAEFDDVFETLSQKRLHQEEQKAVSRHLAKKKDSIDIKDFDVFMYDDTISRQMLSKAGKIFKRRNFAFPVKLRGEAAQVRQRLQSCLETSVMVI
jgi:hypothetical protein